MFGAGVAPKKDVHECCFRKPRASELLIVAFADAVAAALSTKRRSGVIEWRGFECMHNVVLDVTYDFHFVKGFEARFASEGLYTHCVIFYRYDDDRYCK